MTRLVEKQGQGGKSHRRSVISCCLCGWAVSAVALFWARCVFSGTMSASNLADPIFHCSGRKLTREINMCAETEDLGLTDTQHPPGCKDEKIMNT